MTSKLIYLLVDCGTFYSSSTPSNIYDGIFFVKIVFNVN